MNKSNTAGGKRLTAKELGETLLEMRENSGFDNVFIALADPQASPEERWHGAHTIGGALYATLRRMEVIE